jgi:hypothetical protein
VEALRLRNQLDPKRFYRKDEGEGRGIKGLPKYFAVRFAPKKKGRPFDHSRSIPFQKKIDWHDFAYKYTLWNTYVGQSFPS